MGWEQDVEKYRGKIPGRPFGGPHTELFRLLISIPILHFSEKVLMHSNGRTRQRVGTGNAWVAMATVGWRFGSGTRSLDGNGIQSTDHAAEEAMGCKFG